MRYFDIVKKDYRKTDVEITLPTRSDPKSAGYDFYSPVAITLQPWEKKLVFTDVKACMNDDEVLMLYVRSSMGKIPVVLANGTGIIDSSYFENPDNDGHIMFAFYNFYPFDITIKKDEKIGQGIFQKYLIADDDAAEGERLGGYGSTGR